MLAKMMALRCSAFVQLDRRSHGVRLGCQGCGVAGLDAGGMPCGHGIACAVATYRNGEQQSRQGASWHGSLSGATAFAMARLGKRALETTHVGLG